MKHIVAFFNVDTSKAGVTRGAIALFLVLWVLAWTVFGASTAQVGDLGGWFRTFAFGAVGLVTGSFLVVLVQRKPIQNGLLFVIVGGLPLCVVSAWMGNSVPQYIASTELPDKLVEIQLQDLRLVRPALPAYVTIRGYPVHQLTLTEIYTVRDNSTKRDKTYKFSQLPLVQQNWTPDDPVYVVMDSGAYKKTDNSDEVVATGVLYPVVPRPNLNERPWVNPPVGLDTQFTADWYRQNASFNFDPNRLYFLSKDSPGSLKFLPILFSIFTLIIVVVIVRMAMGSAPEKGSKKLRQKT